MINWQHVAQAIEHYKGKGYLYLELPWIVTPEAIMVTLPNYHEAVHTRYGDLVGSAEQAFIQKFVMEDWHCAGRFVAAGPCFRDDDLDELHQLHFFKVELIEIQRDQYRVDDWAPAALKLMLEDALGFYTSLDHRGVYPQMTDDGYDIMYQGIELGSYGIRHHKGWTWVYGTGYADPRFTIAHQKDV